VEEGNILDMDTTATQTIITDALAQYGTAVLAIIGATLAVGVAYLTFRVGWRKTKSALNGGVQNVRVSFSGDRMAQQAMRRGRALNKRDFGHY